MKETYSWAKHLDFMAIDLFSLLFSFFVAYHRKFHTWEMNDAWHRFVVIITLFHLVIHLAANPYSGIFRRRYYDQIGRGLAVTGVNAICMTILIYVFKLGDWYSREVFLTTYLLYFLLATVLNYLWKKLLVSPHTWLYRGHRRTLFLICDAENVRRDIHSIYSTELPLYEICGVHLIGDGADSEADDFVYQQDGFEEQIPIISCDFVHYILRKNIDTVMVTARSGTVDAQTYQTLTANGIAVSFAVETLLGFQTEEQFVSTIGVNRALTVETFSFTPLQGIYLAVKRGFDVLCGLLGLVPLIPFTLAVKLAYLFHGDTAPVLYRQERVGQNGKPFRMWKYRSMVPDAEKRLAELLRDENLRREWENSQKFENDPRITKIGAFLRKTSLDELPQLLNVLRGEMSLVGPRPLVEGELEAHGGLKLYQKVKPGITGWWGCNGRSNIDYRERLKLEYYYVKNCSFYLDLMCIIRTVFAVVTGGGAV